MQRVHLTPEKLDGGGKKKKILRLQCETNQQQKTSDVSNSLFFFLLDPIGKNKLYPLSFGTQGREEIIIFYLTITLFLPAV